MTELRYVAGVLLVVLGTWSGVSADNVPAGWRLDAASGEAVHVASGLRLPQAFEGLTRGDLKSYDSLGTNVSVPYSRSEPYFVLTFYVYPRDESIRQMMVGVLATIAQMHKNSSVEPIGEREIVFDSKKTKALRALTRYKIEGEDVGSWLVMLPDGDRALKVRASFRPAKSADKTWSLVARFLSSLKRAS